MTHSPLLLQTGGNNEEDTQPGRPHRGVNQLNDLDTREWLLSTKSVWYQRIDVLQLRHLETVASALRQCYGDRKAEEVLEQLTDSVWPSRPPTRDKLKAQHPATFAEVDIERLVRFFTKEGERVLDPFVGSGSTLKACQAAGRQSVGIELIHKWAELARERSSQLSLLPTEGERAAATSSAEVIEGDARVMLLGFPEQHFDFVVTSPPYWSVLNKPADHKVRNERVSKGLPTRYSDHESDLANVGSYVDFLTQLENVFRELLRVVRRGRYVAVIVSDFRDGSRFYLYHADVARALETVGFQLAGITILVQDSKTLYPYGMPHAFVSNIHHQYVVIARRPSEAVQKDERG